VRSEYPITNWKKYLAYQAALNPPPVQVGLNPKMGAESAEAFLQPARLKDLSLARFLPTSLSMAYFVIFSCLV
jgi:hypothetical protein